MFPGPWARGTAVSLSQPGAGEGFRFGEQAEEAVGELQLDGVGLGGCLAGEEDHQPVAFPGEGGGIQGEQDVLLGQVRRLLCREELGGAVPGGAVAVVDVALDGQVGFRRGVPSGERGHLEGQAQGGEEFHVHHGAGAVVHLGVLSPDGGDHAGAEGKGGAQDDADHHQEKKDADDRACQPFFHDAPP